MLRSFCIRDGEVDEEELTHHVTEPLFTEEQVQRYSRHIILPNIGGRASASCSTPRSW